jgi:F0F1-type ATP synthase membrane subunit a
VNAEFEKFLQQNAAKWIPLLTLISTLALIMNSVSLNLATESGEYSKWLFYTVVASINTTLSLIGQIVITYRLWTVKYFGFFLILIPALTQFKCSFE